MRLMVYLNGDVAVRGTHISVFFQLMKGEFDDCMEWLFNKIITIVLIHPDEKSKFHTLLIDEAQKKKKMSSQWNVLENLTLMLIKGGDSQNL